MIIVEGPDGAGKTTLVEQLREEFPSLEVGERGTDDRSKLWEVTRPDTYRALSECLTTPNPHIWDRLFWSEFAYWDIVDRGLGYDHPQFTVDDTAVIPHVIKALRAPVIFCLPPLPVVRNNIKSTDQMDGVHEQIGNIYRRYEGIIENPHYLVPGTNFMRYDYTHPAAAEMKQRIYGRIAAYLEHRNVPS